MARLRKTHWLIAVVLMSVAFCSSVHAWGASSDGFTKVVNSIGMELVLIPAGRFTMGSPASERGSQEDEILHKVDLTQAFYMGITEVTEHQWALVMEEPFKTEIVEIRDPETNRLVKKEERQIENPKLDSQLPIANVSWMQAMEFCARLGQLPEEKKEGRNYRLPTEAEWEYACRAGTSTAYSFGDDTTELNEYAWNATNSGKKWLMPVAGKRANPWGLFDMHGNVSEWCHDYYGAYSTELVSDPISPEKLVPLRISPEKYVWLRKVVRGGSTGSTESQCRSGWRGQYSRRSNDPVGFRVVLGASLRESELIVNGIGQRLVKVPAGTFRMGSPSSDPDVQNEEIPRHRVTISRSFYMGETEVTQAQWRAVMETEPWKGERYVQEGDDYAATNISWSDAVAYCRRLSERDGRMYRLPTEAEWEYACRAGVPSIFNFGDDDELLRDFAWFDRYFTSGQCPVRRKLPNAWGLYDMHGNVKEWCSDWYDDSTYASADYRESMLQKFVNDGSSRTDPRGPRSGTSRVQRGGGWESSDWLCRSANRSAGRPSDRESDLGFRIVSESEQ